MHHPVAEALDRFIASTLARYPVLEDPFDPEWRSPCEVGPPRPGPGGQQRVRWEPYRRDADDDFAPLERALEIPIHEDIKTYYGRYFSGGLEADASEGHVSLIQLWNDEDVIRLNENLIGHALSKRRARAPMTIFFACTEPDSELFLSVDNESGAVVLEKPGAKPLRAVAPDLATFLERLEPAEPNLHPERLYAG